MGEITYKNSIFTSIRKIINRQRGNIGEPECEPGRDKAKRSIYSRGEQMLRHVSEEGRLCVCISVSESDFSFCVIGEALIPADLKQLFDIHHIAA